MKVAYRAALLTALIIVLAPSPLPAQERLDRAAEALKEGRTEEALSIARSVAALSPLDAQAQALYALALLRDGDFAKSAQVLRLAASLNPECAEAHLVLGELAIGGGRADEALAHLQVALGSQWFSAQARELVGRAQAERGDFAGAASSLQAVIASGRLEQHRADALRRRIEYYRALGDGPFFALPAPFQKTTVRLTRPDRELEGDTAPMPRVALQINGREAGLFHVDSAYCGNVIISEELAGRLQIETFGRFGAYGIGGDAPDQHGCLLQSVNVGGAAVQGIPAMSQALATFGEGDGGLIGAGLLSRFNCTLDFGRATLTLVSLQRPELLEHAIDDARVAARAPLLRSPILIVSVSVGGAPPAAFILDTAAGGTVVDEQFFLDHVADKLDNRIMEGYSVSGAGGRQAVKLVRDAFLTLADLRVNGVDLILTDLSRFARPDRVRIAGILGRDVLARFRLHLNFAESQMILEDIY